MSKRLNVLIVEDSVDDTELLVRELRRGGYDPAYERVEEAAAMQAALARQPWDVILSDFSMPRFSAPASLKVVQESGLDLPFIIVTGTIGEEAAVTAMKAGAHDFLLKDQLARLTPAIEREMREAQVRRERREAAQTLEDQEKYFRSLIENISDAIVTINAGGVITYASPAVIKMLGYKPVELIGRNIFEWERQDYAYEGLAFFRELLQHPTAVNMIQLRIRGRGGHWRWLEITGHSLLEEPAVQAVVATLRDITERKQAAAAVQASAELAQSTIDSLSSHICVLDESGAVVAVNKSWNEFAIANNAVLSSVGIGANYLAVCDRAQGPDRRQAQQFAAGIRAVMERREDHFEMEYACHSPDQQRWFVGRVTPFQTKGLEKRWVAVAHENVTVRKVAEERLRLRSAALEAAANAIIITNKESQIEWVNPAFTELTGFTAEEAVGRKPSDLLRSGEHGRQFYQQMWETILAGNVWQGELINRRKDGTLYVEEQTITPLVGEDGISHFIGIKQNITERKLAENERIRLLEQVQEQAQHIQQIMNTVPEGVVLFDAQGTVLLSNPAAKAHLKFLADYQPGRPVTQLGERPLAGFFDPPAHDGGWHEISLNSKTFEIIARPIDRPVGLREENQWVVMIKDVTQQREYQRHLQAQEQLAIVGQLAAGIAHDFNNIMGVISIYSEILQEIKDLTDKQRRQLGAIYEQSQHAVALIQQILDFSRRALLEKIPLDLALLVKELVKLLERTLPANITLNLRYHQNEYIVFGDPTRMQQLLMNLALNARDAMPYGGELTFELSAVETKTADQPLPEMMPGTWLKLAVSDTGEGIAPEHVGHIFEPFFTTKQPGQGTGLGLAQVYGIVKQHDGFITVETAVGQGTNFTVYFPLLENQKTAEGKSNPSLDALPQGNETILLVEDNLAMRFSLVDALSQLDYRVVTAANGKEALSLLGRPGQKIDLIVTDWLMPDMDGAALKNEVALANPEAKMLVITGYPLSKGTGGSLPENNVPWLAKPFDLATLAYKIRTILDNNDPGTGGNEDD